MHISMPRRLWLSWIFVILIASPVKTGWSDVGSPEVDFLDQLATQGIPAAYGVLLGELTDDAGKALKEGVIGHSDDLARLANQAVWRDKISRVNQAIGRLVALLDVGGKIYSEQYDDAAVAGTLAIVGELVGSESGKALLKAYGITPPVITALIVSVQITWESHKALVRETTGRQLVSLYSSMESMTRASGRTILGQGDPFPVSPENVEKVWRRILRDPGFRELFRTYVVDQLQKPFPEPGFFDKVDIYLAEPVINMLSGTETPKDGWAAARLDPSRADTPATRADRLEQVQQLRLRQQYDEIKPYVAGLVGQLNRAAKLREQATVARRKLLDLQARLSSGGSIEQYLEKLKRALAMSGVVQTYLSTSQAKIAKAAEEEDYQTLQAHMQMCVDYVRDVVAWLPAQGPTAGLHTGCLKGLKASYAAARQAFEAFREKVRERIQAPKPSSEEATSGTTPQADRTTEVSIDPGTYYAEIFKPLLKPFDWGGEGTPEVIRAQYEKLLEEGQFKPPAGIAGKGAPLADTVESAWQAQNFDLAAAPETAPGGSSKTPDPGDTIEGYYKILKNKVDEKRGFPESILSLQQSVNAQNEAITLKWRKGNNLFWGRDPKPPAGETDDQRKARMASGQAMMDAASAAGAAMKPTVQRLDAMKKAWAQACQMALATVAAMAADSRMDYDAVVVWMKSLRSKYNNQMVEIDVRRRALIAQLDSLSLAPMDVSEPEQAAPRLADGRAYIASNSYTRLESPLFGEDQPSSMGLSSRLRDRSVRMFTRAATLRTFVTGAAGAVLAQADAYDAGCEAMDALLRAAAEDIDLIRQRLDPAFLADDAFARRRDRTPELAKKLRVAGRELEEQAEQQAANMEADAAWLRLAAGQFERFLTLAGDLGLIEQSGGAYSGSRFTAPTSQGDALLLRQPYPHLLTADEKAQASAKLRGLWNDATLQALAGRMVPWLAPMAGDYFTQLDQLPTYDQENFLVQDPDGGIMMKPVTAEALSRAEKLMAGAAPGSESYQNAFTSLPQLLPMGIKYLKENGNKPTFAPVVVPQGVDLARRFTAFRDGLMAAYAQHVQLRAARRQEEQKQALGKARAELPALINALKARVAEGNRLIEQSRDLAIADRQAMNAMAGALEEMRLQRLLTPPYPDVVQMRDALHFAQAGDTSLVEEAGSAIQAIGRLSGDLAVALSELQSRLAKPAVSGADVQAFYDRFRSAYEARDPMQVMRYIDGGWSAGDGTTLDDLEVLFVRTFDMFDEVRFDLSGLKSEPAGERRVRASYQLTITGRIYRNNLKHVEKSSVTEELLLDGHRSRILRTLQGNFWYVE